MSSKLLKTNDVMLELLLLPKEIHAALLSAFLHHQNIMHNIQQQEFYDTKPDVKDMFYTVERMTELLERQGNSIPELRKRLDLLMTSVNEALK